MNTRERSLAKLADLGLDRDAFLDELQSRQIIMLGHERCRQLREKTVALAGIGGGGSITLELLVRAGIGRFRLLDMDVYDVSNMNRQLFATPATVGRPKAEVAAERVHEINPFAEVEQVHHARASSENIGAMLEGADIGMVCTDFPSSLMFFRRHARRLRLPLIAGWCSSSAAGIWLVDYRGHGEQVSLLTPKGLKRWAKEMLGRGDPPDRADDAILALDPEHRGEDETPASIGYTANLGGSLAVAAAIGILTDSENGFSQAIVDVEPMVGELLA